MTETISIHPQLEADTMPVAELSLCAVRLMNNALFPWLVLVPQREGMREITDLSAEEQHLLMDEIAHVSSVLHAVTQADKMNVAALGNVVPQLHVHVIARFEDDAAWPNPVWDAGSEKCTTEDAEPFIAHLQSALLAK